MAASSDPEVQSPLAEKSFEKFKEADATPTDKIDTKIEGQSAVLTEKIEQAKPLTEIEDDSDLKLDKKQSAQKDILELEREKFYQSLAEKEAI